MLNQQHEEGQREGEKTAEEGGGGVVEDDNMGLFLISNWF